MVYIEDQIPVVKYQGLNTAKPVDFSSAATVVLPAGTTIGGSSLTALGTITSASAQALAVGLAGLTNPAFNVDSSTASQADGVNVKGLAAGNGAQVKVITSGTNAPLTIDSAGSGVIKIGATSTGQISIGRGSATGIIENDTLTSIATQNGTPSAAQLLGGAITHASTTGAGTLTLPTGSQLSTAVTGVTVGDSFWVIYANTGNQTVTITGATGSTVIGTAIVPTVKNAQMYFINTGTNTWNVYVILSA
jgi:hypothetical protein